MTKQGTQGWRIATLAFGFAAMTVAAQGGEDSMKAQTAGGPVRCEIEVTPLGGGVELRGVVFANAHVQGAYELRVSKSGNGSHSNVNQAGKFDARPDTPARLGAVTLGGDRGIYRATLKVIWNGEEIECEKTIGGGWL
ncbi:MAG: curli-like amyloid fiber formation chaperone CsgH [Rhodomicrobiaceae bacterium]